MDLIDYKRISALEKRVKDLEQQVYVLQEFTGLRETIKHNLKKFYKEAQKESNEKHKSRKRNS